MVVLQFTPLVGLAGGIVLGVSAAGKRCLTGRILGISGAIKGLLSDRKPWRLAFTGGMLAGAAVAGILAPGAFDVLPASFTVLRAAAGGLMVGLGASIGGGCTSGHGICGNARLSKRSMVNTLAFMASGAAAATLTATAAALGVTGAGPAPLVMRPAGPALRVGAALAGAAVAAMAALGRLGRAASTPEGKDAAALASEAAAGALFAGGLALSGMVRPAKVAAFLSPLGAWDPTLMFVMGGALLVALPAFQWLKAHPQAAPVCGECFEEPAAMAVDGRLLLGGLLFGAGWGLSGMCPGPALVAAVASPSRQVAAYVGAMVAGMALDKAYAGSTSTAKRD